MKVNFILLLSAFIAGCLVCYGFVVSGAPCPQSWICVAASTILLMAGMGISVKNQPRSSFLFKCICIGTAFLLLVVDIIMMLMDIGHAGYIIVNGLLVLVSLTSVYLIIRSNP